LKPSDQLKATDNLEYAGIDDHQTPTSQGEKGPTFTEFAEGLHTQSKEAGKNYREAIEQGEYFKAGKAASQDPMLQMTGLGDMAVVGTLGKVGGSAKVLGGKSDVNKTFVPFRSDKVSLDYDMKTKQLANGNTELRISSFQQVQDDLSVISTKGKYPPNELRATFNPNDGDLVVDFVESSKHKLGIAPEMMSRAIEKVGPTNVKSISGQLDEINKNVYNVYRDEYGLSSFEAALQTPAAKIRNNLGYSRIEFDASSLTIQGYR
jgi:hypothetical protein